MKISDSSDKSFMSDFRKFFFRGLATLLPTILTILLLVKCYQFVQENISSHITEGAIRLYVMTDSDYPKLTEQENELFKQQVKADFSDQNSKKLRDQKRLWKLRREWNDEPNSLIGFFLAMVLVYIVGSYLGHKVWHLFERTVGQIPGFKQVYPYIKQITEYFLGEKKVDFSRVVLVEYPRKGIWSIGLVTGKGLTNMAGPDGKDIVLVFMPSSPTPFTGYVIHAEQSQLIDLPITIEEAIRFTVSGGVIGPNDEKFVNNQTVIGAMNLKLDQIQGNITKENPNDN